MSETTTCSACGTAQAAGSAFCAVCGTAFPRTGRPYEAAPAQAAVPFREQGVAITTEREIASSTQRATGPHPVAPGPVAPRPPGGAPVAGVGRRFVAFLIDTAAIGLVVTGVLLGALAAAGLSPTATTEVTSSAQAQELLGTMMLGYALAGVVGLACWVTVWIWEGRTGRTLGNLAMGLRSVRAEDRSPLGFGRAALRWIVTGLGAIAFGVGEILVALSPAFDSSGRNQGWQDKAAKALVLDVRAGTAAKQAPVGGQGFAAHAATPPAGTYGPPPTAPPPAGFFGPPPNDPPPAGSYGPPPAAPPPATAPQAGGDPWAFPSPAPVEQGAGPTGLITGIPGSAPAAPPPGQVSSPAVAPSSGPVSSIPTAPAASAPSPASAVVVPGPLAADEDPEWDSTRLSVSELRRGPLAPAPGIVLELGSGRRVPVTARALIGRNPQPTGDADEVLVRVEDPTRSVSKTHAEVVVDQGTLWLTDRGSTNGTILTRPGSAPQVLDAGVRVAVPVGSVVQVGDQRLTVRAGDAT
ncbi:RDD family protein [Oerskovia jenensis]|uniref:RDD family protein n=1 Tax=Oerskovia jenensis TaxID=162169 RepID=UPI0036DD4DCE